MRLVGRSVKVVGGWPGVSGLGPRGEDCPRFATILFALASPNLLPSLLSPSRTLRTKVSEALHPGWGVQIISASCFPLGPMAPFSGDTVNAPRVVHAKTAVEFPPFVSVRGCRSVDSRLPSGNYQGCRNASTEREVTWGDISIMVASFATMFVIRRNSQAINAGCLLVCGGCVALVGHPLPLETSFHCALYSGDGENV